VVEIVCTRVLMWVHTCNVTAYRNAVALHVTDMLLQLRAEISSRVTRRNSILRGVPSLIRELDRYLCN
jgi:hypothetical protein